MGEFIDDKERHRLEGAERQGFDSPLPSNNISNGEFFPARQSEQQKNYERRLTALVDKVAPLRHMSRRSFLRSASGMAAAFAVMNKVYGQTFEVDDREIMDQAFADEREEGLAGQFIFDDHSHFLRDDTNLVSFVRIRENTGISKNPELAEKDQTLEYLKFENYIKEMYLDSDTKIALLSGAPSDIPEDWFLTNGQIAAARDRVNEFAGSKRLFSHAIFTPGQPGWLEDMDRAIEEHQPDSWKGYTIGDNTHKDESSWPWRLDDEKVTYRGYEKMDRAGIRNVCVHKGLFPPSAEEKWPHLLEYAKVNDVPKAARDWPGLNFLIYHSGYRHVGGSPDAALSHFERTGRIDWVSDLAEMPGKHGLDNVYADLGATFAHAAVTHPRLAAAIVGILIRDMGPERVVWGTDSIWYGSPQWQIEAFRRLEIPEDMRRKHGFAELGPADGPVKTRIFGTNSARLYGLDHQKVMAPASDKLARLKAEYRRNGGERSNRAYGYVRRS
ncbi:amidohydrolase family protein [Marinobacter salicampi]|uniref:amidohydrolase family protein n=1 Tax=Marinobacter salicampi TaxID=435907 RepID=UPI0014090C43|nr:amidohydrolase family protein [Marinobacter salicampi]